jgi:hypothetical protein
MTVILNSLLTTANQVPARRCCCLVSPQMHCNCDPARNSQNVHKMAAFIGESDITKPISDYGKMLKYRE